MWHRRPLSRLGVPDRRLVAGAADSYGCRAMVSGRRARLYDLVGSRFARQSKMPEGQLRYSVLGGSL